MVTIVKHEWHQVDSQFALELDIDMLGEIYPDMDEDELATLMEQIESGEVSVDEIVEAAYDEGVDLDWDRQYDDWWTDRKGGYEITYELGDESSWVTPDTPPEPTHKCTKCRWQGQSYEAGTQYLREDGSVIEDYYNNDEDADSTKDVCPMCDSELEMTEIGKQKEEEHKKRMAELDEMFPEEADDDTLEQALDELKADFENQLGVESEKKK